MSATGGQGDHLAVAVLGAGIMGSAMARRLLAGGLPVTVWGPLELHADRTWTNSLPPETPQADSDAYAPS